MTDSGHFYHVKLGEQVGYRYKLETLIDAGAFGQVVRAFDYKEGVQVAIKISKNKPDETQTSELEASVLASIQNYAEGSGFVKMTDSFYFRNHYIIVFELLHTNLYKWICETNPLFRRP